MAVELLLSATLPVLFQKLASSESYNFLFEEGVRSKLAKWERKLEKIDAVLSSTEEKQLISRPVKLWLEDLQHLAYDVEDILEEFAYEASRHSSTPSCFKNFTPRAVKFDYSMQSRIEDITSRFEELYRERAELGLIHESSGGASSAAASAAQQRPSSSSLPTGKAVYGRDDAREKILEMVSRDDNFPVIAIVGMGGIGKTTLAREVYNDEKLKDFGFAKKMWVSISEDFDVFRISKSLLESINKKSGELSTLDEVQKQLKEEVRGRKIFLVLDDAWNENLSSWETLKSPFIEGADGSKIIVTTRSKKVAQIMGSSEPYELGRLSDEYCWQLFMEYAFEGKTPCADEEADSHRETIVGKCGGLPLAAKTLGSLLSSMEIGKWKNVLNSKIWHSSDVGGILPVLNLSYYHLPPHLKRCFSYCAIFPKDYEFEEKELGLLWLAEGLIQPLNQHLDLAGEYFRDLCSRSLFQKSTSDNSKYIMHDLVHDLAQSISGEVCFRLDEGANTRSPKKFEKTRRLSYMANECSEKDIFRDLENFKRLRTFFPVFKNSYLRQYLPAMVLFDVLPRLKKLRVLSLERYWIAYLPDSIGDLVHLRYLNFSLSGIKILPESISQLLNLQTLILKDCFYLNKLPSKMRCLTNLYHLDISGMDLLEEMSSGMKELKNLQMLSNFIVNKESSSNLEDLKSLNFLKGVLHISKLENANNVRQIDGLLLNNKKDLRVLSLEWGDLQGEGNDKNVLETLKPPSNLEELTIRSYRGLEFSSWLNTSSSLSRLTVLKLENCENCTSLPSQNLLSSLKILNIKGMSRLERIDMHSSYKSLEILYFEDLQNCQCLDTKGENENSERFPNLRELSIINCPELTVELLDYLPSLEELSIQKCAKWMVSFSSFPKHTKLSVDECEEVVLLDIEDSKFSLESLSIGNCDISFLNSICFCNLRDLKITECETLEFLPERLKQYNIERLTIDHCDSLLFIARNTLPLSLKSLVISYCNKLEYLDDICPTLLERLSIFYCGSLTCVSLQGSLSNTLKELFVQCCANLTTLSSRGWSVLEKLESLTIEHCKSLKSIEEEFHNGSCLKYVFLSGVENLELFDLQNLTGLQESRITNSSMSLSREGILTNLSNIDIKGDVNLSKTLIRWGLHKLTSLKSLSICGFEDSGLILSEDHRMPHSIEDLVICNLAPFRSISDLGTLTSLKSLKIEDSNLNSISDLGSLVSLKSFEIQSWPKIKSIPSFGSHYCLEELSITRCPELKSVACLRNLTSLHTLCMSDCPKLKSIACQGSLTSLQNLEILCSPNPKSLPPSLLKLNIWSCPLLKKQWRRGKGKYSSKIAHIPRVFIDGNFIFNSKEIEYI